MHIITNVSEKIGNFSVAFDVFSLLFCYFSCGLFVGNKNFRIFDNGKGCRSHFTTLNIKNTKHRSDDYTGLSYKILTLL